MTSTSGFATIDYIIFIIYACVIIFMGLWVSRSKKGVEKTAQEYFLADKSLTWWAVGASLIAANISAEHFIGTSGSGFAIGLAISAYEWMAALALIIVAKYFLPVFIDKGIYTMPQFLSQRFNRGVSTAFAVFWLLVYVFVNLTSVSYLGALALEQIMGVPLVYGIVGLLLFSAIYSIYGGMEAVAWTDVIQVFFMVGGGLLTTYLALAAAGEGDGVFTGLANVYEKGRDHFSMIIPQDYLFVPDGSGGQKDAYIDLPGIAVIAGAMWATNLGYWGFNQYIIQKGLAAKSINEAKRGLLFAGYLKLLMPIIVVIPGITAYVLLNAHTPEELAVILGKPVEAIGTIAKSDQAYPWLLKNFVPPGIRGLAFAALAAAIVSSLASMVNSTSTIFTMDIYKPYFSPNASNKILVRVGRIVAIIALAIAAFVAPQLASLDQVFQYIQEYTGYIYPGVVVVFGMGLFWKQITPNAALWTAIATIPAGIVFKIVSPEMPFLLRMGYVFIILCIIACVISFLEKGARVQMPLPDERRQRQLTSYSYLFFVLGLIALVLTFIFADSYAHLAIEAGYFMAAMLIMIGIILYTNARLEMADKNAIVSDPVLFNTGTPFNIGAVGIIVILFMIYYFLWH